MNDDLDRHLDGEVARDALSPADAREADAWGRLLDAFRVSAPTGSAPPWLEARVMADIEALPEPGGLGRLLAWMRRPRTVTLSPLTAGLAAAAIAALVLIPRGGSGPAAGPGDPGTAAADRVVYVQFVLEAPAATSVAVAGDFSGWDPAHVLEDPDGDGVWSGQVAVAPGVHTYMFVVDGSEWVTDPRALRYADDGFGNRNAVLAVTAPVS